MPVVSLVTLKIFTFWGIHFHQNSLLLLYHKLRFVIPILFLFVLIDGYICIHSGRGGGVALFVLFALIYSIRKMIM